MATASFEITGLENVERRLAEQIAAQPHRAAAALYQEAELIMTEAKRLTPVDTGALKGSGHVNLPEWHGRECQVVMSFGGPAASYATAVHENLSMRHKPPTMAKFLEVPVRIAAEHLLERISRRLETR